MPAFPSYPRVLMNGLSKAPTPVVIRSEMERGVPKQRRVAADALVTMSVTLVFTSDADAIAFEEWFYDEGQAGATFFDWVHPQTGQVVQARIVGGDIGALQPLAAAWRVSQRSMRIEYLQNTLPTP